MEKFGLLGKKLGHSLSPFIHNILFEISGINAQYKLYETDNLYEFFKTNKLDGFNVTIPYKKDVFNMCEKLHSSAKDIGAVNCVDNKFVGYNTDVYGYRKSVSEIEDNFAAKVLLLGCGGVGSMIAKQYDCHNLWVAIRNLTIDRVQSIHNKYEGAKVVDIQHIPTESFDLICNSTPIGMFPDVNSSPISKEIVKNAKAVYDTIYNPYETKLLSFAKESNIKHKNGLDMLVLQAVKSHYYWYNGQFNDVDINEIIRLTRKELEKK